MQQIESGVLPAEYQKVDYLYRSAANNGPVCVILASIVPGDVIETGTKRMGETGAEQAIAGDSNASQPANEIYYKTNGQLEVWTSSILQRVSVEYGDIDKMVTNVVGTATIRFIGAYRRGNYKLNARIYYFIIKDNNGNLKYNYVPCYRKSDDEPGFYETVNGVFYPNVPFPGWTATEGEWEIPT